MEINRNNVLEMNKSYEIHEIWSKEPNISHLEEPAESLAFSTCNHRMH